MLDTRQALTSIKSGDSPQFLTKNATMPSSNSCTLTLLALLSFLPASSAFAHHTNLQPIVCYRVVNWDPPLDADCKKVGSTSMGIPIFNCCGPE